jgi:hypothetical protein
VTSEPPKEGLSQEEIERALRLEGIFMPYAAKQRREARQRQGTESASLGLRFAHYTSAEAALSIIRSKRMWMRNTTCMSDYSEVVHGFELLKKYFDPVRTKEFAAALDVCAPGAAMQAIDNFNGWWKNNLNLNIYVASVSEHEPNEDTHGRLSMWRAFGAAATRVALVIRVPNYSVGAQALTLIFSPVAYLTEQEAHQQVRDVLENVARERDFLQTLGHEMIMNYLFLMLFAGVTCLKHEGFREEREWRAIYNAQIFGSPLMERSLEIIAGVPQHIHKIPLDEAVSAQLADLDLVRMLDRVIIGPSPYPWVLYHAFVEALSAAGVKEAGERVLISGIPIRA